MLDASEVTGEPLFWMVVITLGFVIGALNGIILLALRRWRYQEAGYRWTSGFWGALLWAPLTFTLARLPLSWWRGSLVGWTSGDLYLLISLWLILNALGIWRIGRWASQE